MNDSTSTKTYMIIVKKKMTGENLPAQHLALGPQKSWGTGDGLQTSKGVKRSRK